MKENIKESKEAATYVEASGSQEVEVADKGPIIQDIEAVDDDENIVYDLVEDADNDSDYKSDFDSEEEDATDIFEKISKY